MIYANEAHVDINAPTNLLMAEFTTAGQVIAKNMLENFKTDFVQEMFETAFRLIKEEIENGGK